MEQQVERPQLTIRPRAALLAQYGVTIPEFASYVETLLQGKAVSQVYDGNSTFDLTLKVDDNHRLSIQDIKDLRLQTPRGPVTLSQLATITSTSGPNTISRENVQRKIVISANVSGRDLRGVVNDIRAKISEHITLPEGYHIEYGGQFESQESASRVLYLTCTIAIAIIFLLLFMQFRNAKEAGVILMNLPLALIGGIFALVITTGEVSIPAIIGFISLFGIATRNGMLLVTEYKRLRTEEGATVREAIVNGSLSRLNPILMTALTSALALLPLALGGDLPGNEIQSPMAKVILGGLISSTLLNAFIIPVIYEKISNRR